MSGLRDGPEARPAAPTAPPQHAATDPQAATRLRWIVFGVATSFTALAATIIALMVTRTVTFQLALLMLVGLLGLYLGFGVLALVWRIIDRLE